MSGAEQNAKLNEINDLLSKAVNSLRKRGYDRANAERDYKVKRAQMTLKLRAEGIPATLIHDLCVGDKAVADAKFDFDVKEIDYNNCIQAVNAYKLQIRILAEQIKQDWNS